MVSGGQIVAMCYFSVGWGGLKRDSAGPHKPRQKAPSTERALGRLRTGFRSVPEAAIYVAGIDRLAEAYAIHR